MTDGIRLSDAAMLAMAGALCGGCVGARPKLFARRAEQIVFPPPPDEPRVRFLGEIRSSDDVKGDGGVWESIGEAFFGPEAPDRLVAPQAVSVDADGSRVAIADPGVPCVHVFDVVKRAYVRLTSGGDDGPALRCPVGVTWVGDELWVADSEIPALIVARLNASWSILDGGQVTRPASLAYDRSARRVYLSDAGSHEILVFDTGGNVIAQLGNHGADVGEFNYPSQVAVGPDGSLAVADSLNFRVQRISADGVPLSVIGAKGDAPGDFALPKGVAVDDMNRLWVVDAQFENIQTFDAYGRLLMVFGHEGHGPGEFWLPAGICIDSSRRLWVCDTYNRRVQVFEILE